MKTRNAAAEIRREAKRYEIRAAAVDNPAEAEKYEERAAHLRAYAKHIARGYCTARALIARKTVAKHTTTMEGSR